jgi:putative oxidoreductase
LVASDFIRRAICRRNAMDFRSVASIRNRRSASFRLFRFPLSAMDFPLGTLEVRHRCLGELDPRSSSDPFLFGFRQIEISEGVRNTMAQTGEIASVSGKPAIFRVILGWVLCLLLAFVFLMVGGMKLMSKPVMVREFEQVGFGQWFRYFTGALEVTGTVALLVPKSSQWAALLLAVVMVGALVAHFTVLHSSPLAALTMLVLETLTAWLSPLMIGNPF